MRQYVGGKNVDSSIYTRRRVCLHSPVAPLIIVWCALVPQHELQLRGPIYKISYDLAYDYRKFIVRSTDDSDLKRAKISLRNIVS